MPYTIIPPNAQPCVWMSAGLITYKLCDRDLDCEHCPLDAALRGAPAVEPERQPAPPPAGLGSARDAVGDFNASVEKLNSTVEKLDGLLARPDLTAVAAGRKVPLFQGFPEDRELWGGMVRLLQLLRFGATKTPGSGQEVAMTHARNLVKEGLMIGTILIIVAVSLPLVAVAVFLTRGVLLAAALTVVAGSAIAYVFSPRFRGWLDERTALALDYKGLRLAADVAVHPSHSWARVEPDEVFVGADDLAQAVLGPVEAVELPLAGRRVRRGEPLVSLRRGERRVDLRSPVSGTVVGGNKALARRPRLVNESPFEAGWAVRIRSDNPRADRRLLLTGKRAREWFREQVDRLIGTVLADDALAPSLPDGGPVAAELYRHIDDQAWQRLQESIFAAEPESASRTS